ncbi:hypothetical protein NPIL_654921 [Nephila pilipes]|uniref:Uncharacterized protein n=1 Tax=Nephila pilipes TaxID=299642 RepID=A0A8X6U1Q7_NEPPI|nr:hypothetical protein NPIL_149831 [Nephila pilipes]GFT73099.1 hypothetical protein NPIL_654921 [Nephila pilipes]
MQEEVINLLMEMQQNDSTEPSESAWASPIVLVWMKDASTRFCIDYHWLNDITKKGLRSLCTNIFWCLLTLLDGTGFSSSIHFCNCETKVSRSILMVGGSKNSPGNLLVPYIIWAIEWFMSDLMAALKPSSTVGRDSVHLMLCAFIALFRVLCYLSIFPLHYPYEVVCDTFAPHIAARI